MIFRDRLTPFAIVALLGFAVAAYATGDPGPAQPTPAPEPKVREVVPHAKFVKVYGLYHRADRRADRLARVLRHEPSVQEALTIAAIAYRIDRDDLSSTAWCESRHNPRATNGQYLGVMQEGHGFRAASRYFRAGLDPFSPYANIMAAAEVIAVQGYRQWQCQPGGGLAW